MLCADVRCSSTTISEIFHVILDNWANGFSVVGKDQNLFGRFPIFYAPQEFGKEQLLKFTTRFNSERFGTSQLIALPKLSASNLSRMGLSQANLFNHGGCATNKNHFLPVYRMENTCLNFAS